MTTTNANMVIYDQLMQTAYLERIQDVLEAFNANSAGAMVLRNENIEGNFSKDAIYTLNATVTHRNVNSVSPAGATGFGADEIVTVKAPWSFGPIASTEESFKRRGRTPEEHFTLAGQQLAEHALRYQLRAAFAALEGAISGNSDMVASASFAADNKKVLTKGMRKFGDRFARIAAFAMDSATYFDLVDDAIDEKIFEEAGLVVYGGTPGTMGKPVLVTDECPEDVIFGLQAGAVDIVESQAPGILNERVGGLDNIVIRTQAEGAFNVGLLGYSWGVDLSTPAPANPTVAQIGTTANWTKYAIDNKATAGVLIDLSGS
jgi:uncharacterized protein YjdB